MQRIFTLIAVTVLLVLMSVVPSIAQDSPSVLILPVNGAQFLPGAKFDLRIEVHADALPEDFSVNINGEDADSFFGVAVSMDSWTDEESFIGVNTQAPTWRDVSLPAAGEYVVEVIAGGSTTNVIWTARELSERTAKNVILFVADGGSVGLMTAARLLSRGMVAGSYNDRLTFEKWDEIGLVSTSGLDSIITDSANSASSYNTGHKSALNATGVYPDTSRDAFDDPRTETLAEMLKRVYGMSIGVVTHTEYVDATPASVWAHSRQRTDATRADYAAQVLGLGANEARNVSILPEVILGGGARYLLPQSVSGSRRTDDLDLFALYEEAGYTIVETATQLDDAVAESVPMLAGFFHPGNMNAWLDRNVYTDNLGDFTDQPGLPEMVTSALEVLGQNENGFYLFVEADPDKKLHPMDFERGVADLIELDAAVAAAMAWLEERGELDDTLLVLIPDHAHSFDVYGTVDVNAFNNAEDEIGKRDAILIYGEAGFPTYADEDGDGFPDEWDVEITLAWGKVDNPLFTEDFQVSPVPRTPSIADENGNFIPNPESDPNGLLLGGNLPAGASTSVHTLQDVPVYAHGPGAEHFGRSIENFEVFFGMANALGLNPAAAR
jgi:alkaline phosphatase